MYDFKATLPLPNGIKPILPDINSHMEVSGTALKLFAQSGLDLQETGRRVAFLEYKGYQVGTRKTRSWTSKKLNLAEMLWEDTLDS